MNEDEYREIAPESGNCTHCGALVHWDSSVGAYIDDDSDQFCEDGERHALPTG